MPLFPISLLLFESFLTRLSSLSSPPSPSLSLSLGQIRLSCIPDIPAAYVRKFHPAAVGSHSLFHSSFSIPLSFTNLLSICSSTSGLHWTRQTWLHCQVPPHLPSACSFFLPPPLLLFLSLAFYPSEGVRQSHMTASVEGLETGFYTWGNCVKRDNTQSNTQKTELIWDVHSLPQQGG